MSYNTETVSRSANTLPTGQTTNQTNGLTRDEAQAIEDYMWRLQNYNSGVRVMPTKARALVERMPATYDPAPSYRAINKRDIHARKRWGDE
jgi:ribosomal protein S2